MNPIPNFEELLADQVKRDKAEREARTAAKKKKANRKARNQRYHEKVKTERNRKNRIEYNAKKLLRMTENGKRPLEDVIAQTLRRHDKRHKELVETHQDLVKSHHNVVNSHHNVVNSHEDLVKSQDRIASSHERMMTREGEMIAAIQLAEAHKVNMIPAPLPVFGEFDTPLQAARKPSATEFMPTPVKLLQDTPAKTPAKTPGKEMPVIVESKCFAEEGLESADSQEVQIVSFERTGEAVQPHVATISVPLSGVKSLVQVLDCAVLLVNGMIAPIKFLKRHTPSAVTQLATLGFAKTTVEFSDPSPIVQPEEQPIEIQSFGSFLLAKSMHKHFVWKYKQHDGSFIGPVSFKMDSGGAVAIVDGAVVALDSGLLSKKYFSYLRKVAFSYDQEAGKEETISVQEETKDRKFHLPMNRVEAKIVPGFGGAIAFIFAKKVNRDKGMTGNVFVPGTEGIVKSKKLQEGLVVDIASDGTYGFACTEDGEIFWSMGEDWDKSWCSFDGVEGVTSVAACNDCCLAAKGSKALFLFPDSEDGRVLEKDLQGNIAFFAGSGAFASFLVTDKTEDENPEPLEEAEAS